MDIECSFEWNAGYSEEVLALRTTFIKKMGNVLLILKALTRVINKYSQDNNKKITFSYRRRYQRGATTAL